METSTIDESMAESGPDENFAEFTEKEVIADTCEAECVHRAGMLAQTWRLTFCK